MYIRAGSLRKGRREAKLPSGAQVLTCDIPCMDRLGTPPVTRGELSLRAKQHPRGVGRRGSGQVDAELNGGDWSRSIEDCAVCGCPCVEQEHDA